ncbi:MAG: phasin family protein [Hyphomicrobiaceae bacterium]
MMKQFEDVQRLNQNGMDAAMKMMGEWGKSWQAIAAEVSDYTKRSVEDGTQTVEKLMAARSPEQAFEIQSSYVKRAYDDYMAQCTKMSGMCAELAKEAYKPFEKAMPMGR